MGVDSVSRAYEDLVRAIHDKYDGMSKAYQAIAVYLTQNPNDAAVMTLSTISQTCGVHASNFVRFAQMLGYKGFKDIQDVFQRRLLIAAPGLQARINALEGGLSDRANVGARGFLHDLVLRDIDALQELLNLTSSEMIDQAVDLMEKADTIYLVGQLRSAPIVDFTRYILSMLGKRAVLLDASGGLSTHIAGTMRSTDLLLAVSFRFYATEVVNIVERAAIRRLPIVAITDSTLSPLAKNATVLFAVPEHRYTLSRSLAAPMCLAQSLTVALAARLQKASAPRIPVVTET